VTSEAYDEYDDAIRSCCIVLEPAAPHMPTSATNLELMRLCIMETQTVKLPKALTNMMRKVMPWLVVATKHSQGKKDLGYPEIRNAHHSSSLIS
jgi:hypothetical protein